MQMLPFPPLSKIDLDQEHLGCDKESGRKIILLINPFAVG